MRFVIIFNKVLCMYVCMYFHAHTATSISNDVLEFLENNSYPD